MKSESLVIANQNVAVNTFPGLVHTARHTKVLFGKRELENDADVNSYVDELKKAMLEQIAKNRKITLG